MDLDVLAAVGASHLRELPPVVLDELLTGAVRTKIPAGSVAHREREDAPYLELVLTGFSEPATKQALVDAELLNIAPTRVRHTAERDVRVARVLLIELSERARNLVHEIPGSALATVRQRAARQLLDLASMRPSQPDGEFAVQITQQDLAAAAGWTGSRRPG